VIPDDVCTAHAFDLLELDDKDLRRTPIKERKHTLANVLYRDRDGIAFNKHYEGAVVYKHACAFGCEGIVSKRLGSTYRSGQTASGKLCSK
jgi:bifunctional non-homologous end joining protein LigD